MKYKHLAKALQWDETPDNSEGLFLQPEEAASLDAVIGAAETNPATITELTGQNEALTNQATERDATIASQSTTITAQSTTITSLEARIAVLDKKPSGNGSKLDVKEDLTTGEKTPSYADDNNPANQYADSRLRKKKV